MFIVYLDVYRSGGARPLDCTNGGVSGLFNRLALYSADTPPVEVRAGDTFSAVKLSTNAYGNPIIVPLAPKPDGVVGPMMGGNYAATSDARFGDAIKALTGAVDRFYGAVPIHDRYETPAQYAGLSR